MKNRAGDEDDEQSFVPNMDDSDDDESQLNINYEVYDISFESARSVPMKGFSFNFPYVAFSGLK